MASGGSIITGSASVVNANVKPSHVSFRKQYVCMYIFGTILLLAPKGNGFMASFFTTFAPNTRGSIFVKNERKKLQSKNIDTNEKCINIPENNKQFMAF
jgi:hypothetical protein